MILRPARLIRINKVLVIELILQMHLNCFVCKYDSRPVHTNEEYHLFETHAMQFNILK